MDRREAIQHIKRALAVPHRLEGLVLIDEEALDLAIEALKPVGDCISREKTKLAIARAIKDANDNRLDIGCCIYNAIDDVPEEKQNLLSDDTISRADTVKAMCAECVWKDEYECGGDCTEVAVVKGMPPVTPTERTGEWEKIRFPDGDVMECTNCGYRDWADVWEEESRNFCPSCGCAMNNKGE